MCNKQCWGKKHLWCYYHHKFLQQRTTLGRCKYTGSPCEAHVQRSARMEGLGAKAAAQSWMGKFEPPIQTKAGKTLSQGVSVFAGLLSVAS